jgi:hypothetical protein
MELIPTSLHSAGRYHHGIIAAIMVVIVVVLHDAFSTASSLSERDSSKSALLVEGHRAVLKGFEKEGHVPTTVRPAASDADPKLKPAPTNSFDAWIGWPLSLSPLLACPEE